MSQSQSRKAGKSPAPRTAGSAGQEKLFISTDNDMSTGVSPLAEVGAATRAHDPLPVIKVNKVNLADIKTALDDIVKRHLADQSFTPSLINPTVHLSLGYGSIIFALGGMAYVYAYKLSFKASRPALLVAVVGYFTLQTLLWAWKRWVEQGEVFRGKRRRLVKRIETDQVQITSSTTLSPPSPPQLSFSPHTRPSSPPNGSPRPGALSVDTSTLSATSNQAQAPLSPISPIAAASSSSLPHSRDPSASSATSLSEIAASGERSSTGPTYILQIELTTTSNNGKSLLHKARSKSERSVADFIDAEGGVEEGQFARWLEGLLGQAGLVSAEDEGVKNE